MQPGKKIYEDTVRKGIELSERTTPPSTSVIEIAPMPMELAIAGAELVRTGDAEAAARAASAEAAKRWAKGK
jgi:hypothetical protein